MIEGMGALAKFTCPGCGYAAEVSGGPDTGMLVRTQTMICLGCRELVDVETGPSLSLEPPPLKRRRCPRCRSRRFEPWGRADDHEPDWSLADRSPEVPATARFNCPKCGETMVEGAVVTLWD
jgi:predicted nucleic-acid-binding Zn-ribbon protein